MSGRAPGRHRKSDETESRTRGPARPARTARRERAGRPGRRAPVVSLHCEAHGNGPPLVLVHGLCGSKRWWRRNLPALAASHRVWAVDLAGFGESRAGEFVLEEAAASVRACLAAAGVARADVIGHSMGGLVAAELAADFPDAVRRLVLVDAAGLPFTHGLVAQTLGIVREAPRIPVSLYPLLLDDTRRAGLLATLRLARRLLETDVSEKLQAIAAPTLVVWGEKDTIVPLRLGVALAQRIRGARFEVLPRAGHIPMWEEPERWNRLVLSFLDAPRRG